MVYTESERFEWDPSKARSNEARHGISFTATATVFDDPQAWIIADTKHSRRERREWIIGESDDSVLVVVFTRRYQGVIRLISARRANRQERMRYEELKKLPV